MLYKRPPSRPFPKAHVIRWHCAVHPRVVVVVGGVYGSAEEPVAAIQLLQW